jgi:TP901 family phage tail tape measure protein
MKEAAQFAEATQILMNVSEFTDVSQATDTLISSVQAFGYTAETSMDVVDLLNTIGNNYAISTADLAKSLTKSSASLVAAGGDLAEAVALTATANKIIQDADSVGTALKTTSLRLRNTSVTVLEEEGLDSEGAVTSKSKLQSKVKALSGVDILTQTGEYKSTYEILRDIADVWESMNDMDQAALLELISGKRNSSVIAAILQNPEELKDAFEDANNAQGSALKENEKYLDSIQGKVDQFTNSVQTMWNNAIDSGLVKDVVEFGTEIINVVDDLGLFNSALLAIGAYKGLGHVFNSFKGAGITVKSLSKDLWAYISGVKATTVAESGLTQAQVAKKLAQQGVDQANIQTIMTNGAMATSIDGVTRETFEATLAELGYTDAQIKSTSAKVFGKTATEGLTFADRLFRTSLVETLATQYLTKKADEALTLAKYNLKLAEMGLMNGVATTADVQAAQAAVEAASIPVDIAKTSTTQLLGAAFKQLMVSIWGATKAIVAFLFTNPVGWIILAIGALAGGIAIFNHFHKTTEELREELSELQSELSDVQQELENVNNELETTQSRMAELLAMESLSFTEEEELKLLQKKNDELQREIDLLELKEKQKKKETAEKFVETMSSSVDAASGYNENGERDIWGMSVSNKDYFNQQLIRYEDYVRQIADLERKIIDAGGEDTKEGKKLATKKKKLEDEKTEIETYINKKTDQWNEDLGDLDYFTGDDLTDEQKQTNAWIDYIRNMEDKWAIASGGKNAETNAITRIFNKEEFEEASSQIDALVEKLEKDPGNKGLESEIRRIIETTPKLKESLDEAGSSVDSAFDYFTMFSSGTIDDKIDELSDASKTFSYLLRGGLFDIDGAGIGLADLFNEEGKIIQTRLSQIFIDTDEQTRQEITNVLEGAYDAIKDGLDNDEIESMTSKLGFKFSRQIMEVQKSALATETLELFPGLEDEISGIIDTFDELVKSVGSVADAMETLDQARAEEAYSGSVSLETLSKLMDSTENYADLIEVDETGAITLASNAQEILVQQKIDAIKKNAELALADAELALEEAIHAEQTYTQTGPAQDFLRGMTMEVGGAVAFVTSLWSDLTSGNWDGAWDRAKAAREDSLSNSESEYSKKAKSASVTVEEARKNVEKAEKMNKVAQGLTPENVKERSDSDEASGGSKTADDAEKKLAEEKWESLVNEYENKLALITNERDLIQAEIDSIEARGGKASKELYNDLIRSQLEEKQLLEDKKAELEAYLIEYGDSIDPDTWTDYNNEINETAVAIKECTTNIYDFAQSLHDIDMHYFEQALDEVSRLAEEIDFVMSLFEDEEMSDEAGNWTEAGITKINLLRDQMTTYAAEATMWQSRLSKLGSMKKGENGLYSFDKETKQSLAEDFRSMFKSGKISKEVFDGYISQLNDAFKQGGFSEELWTEWNNEAEDGLRDAISSQQDARDSMLDMYDAYLDKIEDGVQKEIEAYEDLIDAKKEELQAERDLHDFRNKIKDQTKDIASLERRIAALSGSTAAADVAERRKLEAELAQQKEALNNTYYDHAQDARSSALDSEANAFAEAKNKYVENMREAAKDTEWVINEMITNGIFNADVANDFLLRIRDTYNTPLSKELTGPWAAAAKSATDFKDQVGIIAGTDIPPSVTMISDDIRDKLGTDDENNPWNQAIGMAEKYSDFLTNEEFALDNDNLDTFEGQLNGIISKWNDVKKAANDAYTAQNRTYEVGGTDLPTDKSKDKESKDVGPRGNNNVCDMPKGAVRNLQNVLNTVYGAKLDADGSYGSKTKAAVKSVQSKHGIYASGLYDEQTRAAMKDYIKNKWQSKNGSSGMVGQGIQDMVKSLPLCYYAKGTLGTTRDQWAITDEIGDELVLVPGANGNLSFMRKGTSVVPADITKNLVGWGKLNPDMMNLPNPAANINMISNAVNKPELNLNVDNFLRCDNVSQDSLPELKQFVKTEMNNLIKQMNYALKGKGAR